MRYYVLLQRRNSLSPAKPSQWVGGATDRRWFVYHEGYFWRLTWRPNCGMHRDRVSMPDGRTIKLSDPVTSKRVAMRRVQLGSPDPGGVKHLAAVESTAFSSFMRLVFHCAALQYEDGTPRRPGWFTIKTMGASWVIEVKDPDGCARLVVVERTLDDALVLAQVLLESDQPPWERDQWLEQQAAKERRKK